jgi:DNA-binding transcriptional MerR regulator
MTRQALRQVEQDDLRTYGISELALFFDITPRTIRFYEDQGLLTPARQGLNRIYNHRDKARLTLICRGKRLGFSLAEIRDFLELYDTGRGQQSQMRYFLEHGRQHMRALRRQLDDIRQTLSELEAIESQVVSELTAEGVSAEEIAHLGRDDKPQPILTFRR